MNYNNGQIIQNFYNLDEEELKKIANDFSEENILLKELLLALWKQGIKTEGCCKGHKEKNQLPYISIKSSDNLSLYVISQIIELLLQELNDEIYISFLNNQNNDLVISFYTTIENSNKMFNFISQIQNTSWKKCEFTKIMLDIIKLQRLFQVMNLSYQLQISKKEMQIGIAQKNSLIFFNKNIHNIESIYKIIHNKTIPLESTKTYSCTKESLKHFTDLLYTTFTIQPEQEDTNKHL